MPGPVSDSYDPVFSTAANAAEVREACEEMIQKIGKPLGPKRLFILDVVRGQPGSSVKLELTRRELRILRWALYEAKEGI